MRRLAAAACCEPPARGGCCPSLLPAGCWRPDQTLPATAPPRFAVARLPALCVRAPRAPLSPHSSHCSAAPRRSSHRRTGQRCLRPRASASCATSKGCRCAGLRAAAPRRVGAKQRCRFFQKEPPPGISGTPTESNIMFWQAVIFGPEDTPWEGGARLPRSQEVWVALSPKLLRRSQALSS